VLISLLIKEVDGREIIVRSSESLNVYSHTLEHFELISISLHIEDLSPIVLEELDQREATSLVHALRSRVFFE
jgi:hypothetical protein